jgi:phage shock protein A
MTKQTDSLLFSENAISQLFLQAKETDINYHRLRHENHGKHHAAVPGLKELSNQYNEQLSKLDELEIHSNSGHMEDAEEVHLNIKQRLSLLETQEIKLAENLEQLADKKNALMQEHETQKAQLPYTDDYDALYKTTDKLEEEINSLSTQIIKETRKKELIPEAKQTLQFELIVIGDFLKKISEELLLEEYEKKSEVFLKTYEALKHSYLECDALAQKLGSERKEFKLLYKLIHAEITEEQRATIFNTAAFAKFNSTGSFFYGSLRCNDTHVQVNLSIIAPTFCVWKPVTFFNPNSFLYFPIFIFNRCY